MHDEHYMTVLARLNPGVTRGAGGRGDDHARPLARGDVPQGQQGAHRPRVAAHGGAGRRLPAAALRAARRGRLRAAHRLRQHRQPAAGARRRSGARDRHPRGDRRGPASPPGSRAGGKPGARGRRRAAGAARGATGAWLLLAAYGPEDVPRLSEARVDGPVLGFRRRAHRAQPGWCSAWCPRSAPPPGRRTRRSRKGGRRGLPRRQPRPAAERAGRRRDRAGAGAPHRRGSPDSELRRAQQRGSGLRSSGSRGGSDLAPRDVVPDTRSSDAGVRAHRGTGGGRPRGGVGRAGLRRAARGREQQRARARRAGRSRSAPRSTRSCASRRRATSRPCGSSWCGDVASPPRTAGARRW